MRVETCDDSSLVLIPETALEKSIVERWFKHRYEEKRVPYIGISSGCNAMYISLRRPASQAEAEMAEEAPDAAQP